MGVIRLPKFMQNTRKEPADDWDREVEAIRGVGEWLASVDGDASRARVLAYWWWRLKDGKGPTIDRWVDAVVEESADELMVKHGFGNMPIPPRGQG